MTNLTDCFRLYSPGLKKVRVGKSNDGGYVMCEGIPADSILSGGVAGENSWELAAQKMYPDLICHAYDPVNDPGTPDPGYAFHNEPVGYRGLYDGYNALVKIDIETHEWSWLDKAPLDRIAQLIVELHDPNSNAWDWSQLDKLANTHYLVHFHGNNWSAGYLDVDGVLIPETMECTYVRKDLLGPNLPLNKDPIPHPNLDQPNLAHLPDLQIYWPPFVNR